MNARNDHVLGDLVEAGRLVLIKRAPFSGVDGTAFEHGIDLAARRGHRRRAQVLGDFEPGTGGAQLETGQISQRLDGLARMQEGLRRADKARERDQAGHLHVEVTPQLQSAALVEPVQHALRIHGAGVSAEQHQGFVLAPIVAGPGMARFGDALGNGGAHFQTLGQLAGRENLDFDAAVGQELDLVGKGLGADFHQRPTAPTGGHLPIMFGRLRTRGGDDQCRGGAEHGQFFQQLHLVSSRLVCCRVVVSAFRRLAPSAFRLTGNPHPPSPARPSATVVFPLNSFRVRPTRRRCRRWSWSSRYPDRRSRHA